MEGYISSDNLPLLKIELNKRPITCLVDTGYNGYLWMDEDLADRYKVYSDDEKLDVSILAD